MEGTFLWGVSLVGTVENAATIVTVFTSKRCRRPLHFLVGFLAFTDFLICLLYIPGYTYYLLEGTLGVTEVTVTNISSRVTWSVCTIGQSVFTVIASSTLTIKTLIAGYLYVYTKSKITAEKMFTLCNTVMLVFSACLVNIVLLGVPFFIGFEPVDFYPHESLCLKRQMAELHVPSFIYSIATLAVHVIQLLFMCFCFVRVHFAIHQGQCIWEKQSKPDPQNDHAKETIYKRAMKTTVLLFVSFCFCWLPIYVVNILDPFTVYLPLHHVAMDLLLLKSAINPAIYIYGIRSVRRELKLLLMCRCQELNTKHNIFKKAPNSSSFDSGKPGASGSTETC